MLSRESFATVTAVVGFGFRLRNHHRLLVLYLLLYLWLLDNLHLLLVCCLDLHLLVGCLVLLHLYLLVRRALWLYRLLNHLTRGGDYLYWNGR